AQMVRKVVPMSSSPPRLANVRCPACRASFNAPVVSIIDVQKNSTHKALFLQGRLNVSTCPQCGTTGMMNVPIAYHDADKEFLLCLVPPELGLNETERQRAIGEMSRAVMNGLPQEARKGYLLRPRIFLTVQSMAEAILEGDGITKDMLQAQERKIELIEQMVRVVGDGLALSNMIAENQAQFDEEFFALLSSSVQGNLQAGQTEIAERLNVLLEKLLEQTPAGREIAAQQEKLRRALEGVDENMTQEQLLGRILSLDGDMVDDVLGFLISVARPLIDYRFFQLMTERMDKAEQSGDTDFVERVRNLRAKILDLTQQLDTEVREAMEARADLLGEMLTSADPKSAIRAHIEEIDDAFMSVLGLNLQQAAQRQEQQAVQRLEAVRDAIYAVMLESAPPEMQFIQKLLNAEYPDETRNLLQNNPAQVNARLVETMKLLVDNLNERQRPQLAEKLSQIAAQAQLIVGLA
ncbi:MAG: CpXC domain-containing protein, partial [Anaerolineae bacterium]|nr:CpXC domain-containing protein [Anaerolineae bacterium]